MSHPIAESKQTIKDEAGLKKHICIHGHFYQPPRENPWLEEVELQDSAHPYHDWNERITAECYAPNIASRILDTDKHIINIVNNYSKINFNFGPTLLSWMERHSPDVYQGILEADRQSQERFSGHGSAIAQAFNHMIMPLANARDKQTQVVWGIYDFQRRFQRKPEGMWLPETAVDLETLDILASNGIKFTILSSHQARRVRKIGEEPWHHLTAQHGIDPQKVYLCRLPSGKSINLFFYDGPISRDIAFADLLRDGARFAHRMIDVFPKDHPDARLVHVATDGESYGHHHRYGEMALSYCLYHIEAHRLAKVTNYGEYLEKHPAADEVEIVENSSWSCAHGVERWRANCGCCSGGHSGWQQEWRAPLRNALDWLRDTLIPLYEQRMKDFAEDPWKVRNQFIEVLLDRSDQNVEKFIAANFRSNLDFKDKVRILKLLELQRHAMFMYTSCAWFFDEVTGIEPAQIMQYAARVIQLAREVCGVKLESEFMKRLEAAPSNISRFKNAAFFYQKYIKPASVDLLRVGAHYAMSSLFEEYSKETNIYCYSIRSEMYDLKEAGKQKLVVGRARIRSKITWEEGTINFAVLHLGDHNLNGGVRLDTGGGAFHSIHVEIKAAFLKSDIPAVIRLMNNHFGLHNYSLWHLFRHEQKKILDQMLKSALDDIETHSRQIYEDYYPFIQASRDLGIALPKALSGTVEFILNQDLLDLLESDSIELNRLQKVVGEVTRWGFQRDKTTITFVASRKVNQMMEQLLESPHDLELLQSIEILMSIVHILNLDLDLWKAQNIYFELCQEHFKAQEQRKELEDKEKKWLKLMKSLGHFLDVKI